MRLFALFLIATLSFSPAYSAAQSAPSRNSSAKKSPASPHKLIAVIVKGGQRYSPADVIAASGLKIGDTVSEDDFRHAAELLGETGAFANVVYSYSYSSEGTKLELQTTESDKVVPAVFENFVWFDEKELIDAVHKYVPLFHGELPVGGNVAELVADALQALLVQRGSKGHVDYMRAGDEGKPIDSILFTVTGVAMNIRNIDFPGASPAEMPLLATAARKLPGDEYLQSKVALYAEHNLLPIYFQRGYLKAQFARPQAKIVQDEAQGIQVDLKLPVDSGREYKLANIAWTGNTAIPADKLNPLLHVAAGQVANAVQLRIDLENAQKLYKNHGYMAAKIDSVPQFNDSNGTVSYELRVQEGDLYRMGDVDFHGLDSHTEDRMRLAWALREGDPYDASYPQRFVKETGNIVAPNVKWAVSIHESLNQKDKTVDVELRFTPQGMG
jgi:outer membrane protein insertion porin family